jgi:uncharacterized protein (TIGR03067 family)
MTKWFLTVVLVGMLAFSLSQAAVQPKNQFAKLDGTWTIVKMEIQGKSLLEKDGKGKLIIKDGKVTSDGEGAPKDAYELSKILDPSKDPKQLTIPNFEGGDPKKGVTLIAIYEVVGDELRVCAQAVETAKLKEREEERPKAFDSKQGVLLIFKREKK